MNQEAFLAAVGLGKRPENSPSGCQGDRGKEVQFLKKKKKREYFKLFYGFSVFSHFEADKAVLIKGDCMVSLD